MKPSEMASLSNSRWKNRINIKIDPRTKEIWPKQLNVTLSVSDSLVREKLLKSTHADFKSLFVFNVNPLNVRGSSNLYLA